jgi:hypothetical protein
MTRCTGAGPSTYYKSAESSGVIALKGINHNVIAE